MEKPTNKNRTPSRCREWERQRRNKFNDAITKLGEVVRDLNKPISTAEKDENTQYPKIEIVQKAILCLKNCNQERIQLKAEILALQVRVETEKSKCKEQRKDAFTQVNIVSRKKDSHVKSVVLAEEEKSATVGKHSKKRKSLKDTTNHKKTKTSFTKSTSPNGAFYNLPKILPRSSISDKKGADNTIVVLPATPYVFPQRPFLLPTLPSAIVLVDQTLPSNNKNIMPILNRTAGGDITKTTMVNILPISAFSHPLSVCKTKKSIKYKTDNNKKKHIKKVKPNKAIEESLQINKENIKEKSKNLNVNKTMQSEETDIKSIELENTAEKNKNKDIVSSEIDICKVTDKSNIEVGLNILPSKDNEVNTSAHSKTITKSKEALLPTNQKKLSDLVLTEKESFKIAPKQSTANEGTNTKVNTIKEIVVEDKLKGSKMTSILDTSLCEGTVDTGNARLELAEEFLAASPTAAFLMSFPLVSGNRADSPAEENQNVKENIQRRIDVTTPNIPYYEKISSEKSKTVLKLQNPSVVTKNNDQQKFVENCITKKGIKTTSSVTVTTIANDNPFLSLPMSIIPTSCALSDSTFSLDFDCNSKSMPNHSTNYATNSNIFFKSDPFSTVKSTIYSTSTIPSGHEFNNLSLYPCAMEKYNSKNKPDFTNVEDSLMKMGSSRLTYDIDLGWSHKGFDFVNCTSAPNTYNKDNVLTTPATPYSTTYNPFNPEFHVPLVSSSSKKNTTKATSSFADTITSFYSQPTSLWSEDLTFYTNSNINKATKHNFMSQDNMHSNLMNKINNEKRYDSGKQTIETPGINNLIKPNLNFETKSNFSVDLQMVEKYTKKSPSKMHINWMTSEIRPMQTTCNPTNTQAKEHQKLPYTHSAIPDTLNKKIEPLENNYFNLPIHNFPPQTTPQDEFQMWPSARPLGTTEITMEPPPINLPTLVGDLALGPHEKKKNAEFHRTAHAESQNCSNFLSVAQLMNRTMGNIGSHNHSSGTEAAKANQIKQNTIQYSNDTSRKSLVPHQDTNVNQPYYNFNNEAKTINSYDNMTHFPLAKTKPKSESKNPKTNKNSYSAEALIRGGPCNQKVQDNSNSKYVMPMQKYDFNASHDNSVAQVSHFPPIIDYSENGYSAQQLSGTTLYNATTNTISNSFYSNFMPGSGNLMSTNYTGGPFTSEYIDYSQSADCNFTNQKYEELKIRNNPPTFQQEKLTSTSNYKSSRRDSAPKHKLECSKKESNKKYQSKKSKLNTSEVEDWNDGTHLLWQNKALPKRHGNAMPEEIPFPNYVGNQLPSQFQPELFNGHLMPPNVQTIGNNADRSLSSFPVTSRANFNLSTIFPEITMVRKMVTSPEVI